MTTDEQLAFRALADFGRGWATARQRSAKARAAARRPLHPETLAQLLAVIASSTSRAPRP